LSVFNATSFSAITYVLKAQFTCLRAARLDQNQEGRERGERNRKGRKKKKKNHCHKQLSEPKYTENQSPKFYIAKY